MKRRQPKAIDAVSNGVLAAIAGTVAMDTLWYRRYRHTGGTDNFLAWESSAGTDSYEQAAAPAQVGKRVVEGLMQTELPPYTARAMNNLVHWATGLAWGTVHGVLAGSARRPRAAYGLATGALAWGTSYATLAPAKIYKPIWQYPAAVLWSDLSAHLVFGLGLGAAFRLLSDRSAA
jgi:hypothetical protein